MGEISYENAKLSFYPDFMTEVQKKRRQFSQVRAWLREKELKYAMLYPTRLRIQDQERTHFFTIAEAASDWLDQRVSTGQ